MVCLSYGHWLWFISLFFSLFNWFSQRKEPKMISCVIFFDVLMNGKQTQNKLKISKLVSQFACPFLSFFLFFKPGNY